MIVIDTKKYRDVAHVGRAELIERILELCTELEWTRAELVTFELSLESYRRSFILPGWFCPGCHVFNGEAKQKRAICRACDIVERPNGDGEEP